MTSWIEKGGSADRCFQKVFLFSLYILSFPLFFYLLDSLVSKKKREREGGDREMGTRLLSAKPGQVGLTAVWQG